MSLPHSKYQAKTRRETGHNFGRYASHYFVYLYNN